MASTRGVLSTMAAAFVTMGSLAACEPVAPVQVFTVTTTDPGDDLDPGDGICEVTADLGDCSLTAAVQEADAVGTPAEVVVPDAAGHAYPPLEVTVSGSVFIRAETDPVEVEPGAITVAAGASLRVVDVDLRSSVTVAGLFDADRTSLVGSDAPALKVLEGAVAVVTNAFLVSDAPTAVHNEGHTVVRYTTVIGGWETSITSVGAAVTLLQASAILGIFDDGPLACTGAVLSDGYNVAFDDTCGLTGPGDQQFVSEVEPFPSEASVRRDTVPAGTLGCGTEFSSDISGAARPVDSNGDGVASCDSGAWETAFIGS